MSTTGGTSGSVEAVEARVAELAPMIDRARAGIGRVLVGQRYLVDRLLIGLLCDGHVLLEGVPGLAKTTAVKALARASTCGSPGSSSHRICCPPT